MDFDEIAKIDVDDESGSFLGGLLTGSSWLTGIFQAVGKLPEIFGRGRMEYAESLQLANGMMHQSNMAERQAQKSIEVTRGAVLLTAFAGAGLVAYVGLKN